METLVTAVDITLLGGLLISPIVLLRFLNRKKIKYKFIAYLTIGVLMTAFIVFVFGWWSYASDKILLTHYGYSFDGWSDKDYYKNVAPENLEKVKGIVTSISGIGWPLKVILTYAFYLPYILLVYAVTYLIGRWTRKPAANN